MEKNVRDQFELFSQPQDSAESAAAANRRSAFSLRIWGHEKRVLIAVGVFIVGILAFSLGVEKGRREHAPALVAPEVPVKSVVSLAQPADAVLPKANTASGGSYTIQVASFKDRAAAEVEAQGLKKKGFKADVLIKGRYIILCVGNFSDRETARAYLTEMGKYYRDCIIRRL